MRTLGLIGGMTWRSSAIYYNVLNEETARLRGGFRSATSIMYSLDSQAVAEMQHAGDWRGATALMIKAARGLERAGAELLLICSNTMHLVSDEVEAAAGIPLLHSADATADTLRARKMRTVGFLGTRFTMDNPFYTDRLQSAGEIQILLPPEGARDDIHRIVYEELTHENIVPSSQTTYLQIIDDLAAKGAEGIILGCTEMPLLFSGVEPPLPLLDTAELHAKAAVRAALGR